MSDRSLEHWNTDHRSALMFLHRRVFFPRYFGDECFQLLDYLDDDLQGFDLLIRGPGLLQGLVQLLDAVGVILLGEVQQLSLGTLHTHTHTQANK